MVGRARGPRRAADAEEVVARARRRVVLGPLKARFQLLVVVCELGHAAG